MRRLTRGSLCFLFISLLILSIPIQVAANGAVTVPSGNDFQQNPSSTSLATQDQGTELDPGRIVLSYYIHPNGTAYASVSYWIPLRGEDSAKAFKALQQDIRRNRSQYVDRFERRVGMTARNAERRTGRQMDIQKVSVRAYQDTQDYGVVQYSYWWKGFASVKNDRIIVGPTLGGLYLSNQTQLVISWPKNYEVKSVTGTTSNLREHSAIWVGPTTFGRSGAHLVLQPEGGFLSELFGVGVIFTSMTGILILSVVAAWRYRRDGRESMQLTWILSSLGLHADSIENADNTVEEETTAQSETNIDDATSNSTDEESDIPIPPELLSNTEALLQELEQRGGRVKQKELVDALDWSNAKGSRVINKLRDDDQVETFRLGNENVVMLPDQEKIPNQKNNTEHSEMEDSG